MARAGILDHPKFKRLVFILQEPIPHCLGYLECLWQTAHQLRSDRIGDALDVEINCAYPGERGRLVKALVECRFVDDRGGVFYVHSFLEHSPQFVKRAIKRKSANPLYVTMASHVDDKQPETVTMASHVDGFGGETVTLAGKEKREKSKEEREESKENPTLFIDPVKANAEAKKIVADYRSKISHNGSITKAEQSVATILCEHAVSVDELRAAMRLFAEQKSGDDRNYVLGAASFFDREWVRYLEQVRDPPKPDARKPNPNAVDYLARQIGMDV